MAIVVSCGGRKYISLLQSSGKTEIEKEKERERKKKSGREGKSEEERM